MKLVEGASLSEHLPRLAGEPRAAVRLLAAVARAIHHAHQRGIIHSMLPSSRPTSWSMPVVSHTSPTSGWPGAWRVAAG